MQNDTEIAAWHIEPTTLTDGSKVYDVIGASDQARVVFNCIDEAAARDLQSLLNGRVSGASAEAL